MRIALALLGLLAAGPAQSWDFTATPVCTLSHDEDGIALRIIHDPREPEPYAITLTRPDAPWSADGVFSLDFAGPRPNTISTDRHRLSADGTRLTVTDRGFGNLLDGLAFNHVATARLAETLLPFSLAEAAEPVAAFRACADALAV